MICIPLKNTLSLYTFMTLSNFSGFVRNRAELLNLSIVDLAKQTGISRQALYGLLDGTTSQARVSTLVALASALQVHPVVLFRHMLSQLELPKLSTTGAKYQFDASGFIAETVPDNTTVFIGQTFCKIWEIQNIGHIAWQKRKLVCLDMPMDDQSLLNGVAPPHAQRRLLPSEDSIDIPDATPGDTVLLSVQFTAPAYPCTVISYWKMMDDYGDICFPETEGLSCLVQVVSI